MSNQELLRRFEEIGARAKLVRAGRPRIDVRVDRRGEYFELGVLGLRDANVMVVDTDDVDRALLLLVRNGWEKSKFLVVSTSGLVRRRDPGSCGRCGRRRLGEGRPPAGGRSGARRTSTAEGSVPPTQRGVRAAGRVVLPAGGIARRRRARRPPRRAALARLGQDPSARVRVSARGETVYELPVPDGSHGGGVRPAAAATAPGRRPVAGDGARPRAVCKGGVRHPDHATIRLHGWHRVLMNTEREARAMQHVAFLD